MANKFAIRKVLNFYNERRHNHWTQLSLKCKALLNNTICNKPDQSQKFYEKEQSEIQLNFNLPIEA